MDKTYFSLSSSRLWTFEELNWAIDNLPEILPSMKKRLKKVILYEFNKNNQVKGFSVVLTLYENKSWTSFVEVSF